MLSHKTSVTMFNREIYPDLLVTYRMWKTKVGNFNNVAVYFQPLTHMNLLFIIHIHVVMINIKRQLMLCIIVCDNEYFFIILSHIPRRRKSTTYRVRG